MRTVSLISTTAFRCVAATGFAACSLGETGTTGTEGGTTTTSAGGSGGSSTISSTASGTGGGQDRPSASEDLTRDIVTTDLELDRTTLLGKATITIAGSATSKGASFEGDYSFGTAAGSISADWGPGDYPG